MKLLIIFLLYTTGNLAVSDSNGDTNPYSIQLVAKVQEKSEDFVTLNIEEIISHGSKIYVLPREGDKVTVRLPARRPPENHTTIVVELQEKISPGENPSSYIMLNYRTIE